MIGFMIFLRNLFLHLHFFRIFFQHWNLSYEKEMYERIIENIIGALPKKAEASTLSLMEDQAHEEDIDEEPSHVPLEDQEPFYDPIEDQEHEEDFGEDFDGESIQEFIHPPHEIEGMVSYSSLQIFEFDNFLVDDLEMNLFEEKPLGCNDKTGNLVIHARDENESSKEHSSL